MVQGQREKALKLGEVREIVIPRNQGILQDRGLLEESLEIVEETVLSNIKSSGQ